MTANTDRRKKLNYTMLYEAELLSPDNPLEGTEIFYMKF